jgi:hypothetical protein
MIFQPDSGTKEKEVEFQGEAGMFFSLFSMICLAAAFLVFYAAELGAPGFFLGWQPTTMSAITLGVFSIALSSIGRR